MKACPICKKSELLDSALSCPQCNSDLTCFAKLERLAAIPPGLSTPHTQSALVEQTQHQEKSTQHPFLYLALALGNFSVLSLFLICFWIWSLHKDLAFKITTLSERVSSVHEQNLMKIQSIDKQLENAEEQRTILGQKIDLTSKILQDGSSIHKTHPIFPRRTDPKESP